MNNYCDKCHKNRCSCDKGCNPARYDKDFLITPDPFDNSKVDIMVNGALKRTKIPVNETDTKITLDPITGNLNYSAEKHTDVISGKQLGGVVEVDDLSNVRVDDSLPGNCYELIFHKYGGCGEGCISPLDAWSNFNINSEGAKQDWIKYVRGANAYGCPTYLDEPSNKEQYWFAGWRKSGEHHEFGYYQAEHVPELPKDASGEPYVMSSTESGKPVLAPIKVTTEMLYADAICSDIIPASGFRVAEGGGHYICYYPHIQTATISIDFVVTSARPATTYFDLVIGTIENTSIYPGGLMDLPTHWVWENNSNGAIVPVAIRVDSSGRVLLSGYVPARTTSGKASYIALGIDDAVSWAVGV